MSTTASTAFGIFDRERDLDRPALGGLDQLLGEGLAELDITQAEHDLAVQRYEELATFLDERWAATHGSNAVFSQGSFKLGTVVRNVSRNDEIDIDIVAVRDVIRGSISQEELKREVGDAVRTYANSAASNYPDVGESSRCWTLTWPEMHMDVLPAIPNPESHDLLIPDRDVRMWLASNPSGYAAWFAGRSRVAEFAHRAEAKRLDIQAVPQWRRRTVLQRVVQALKRHRDVYFADRLDDRPASIVITTLAALAYAGGTDLYGALRQVTTEMGSYLDVVDGVWVLQNPAQLDENFTDAWATEPQRAALFFEWLRAAEKAFAGFEVKSGLQHAIPMLEAAFGSRFARGASRGLADELGAARHDGALRMHTGGVLGAASQGPVVTESRPVRRHGFAGGPSSH
ncbi:nucleotidyltransferase domain-containing protein [Luteimicrobium subarcticum]|uniref:Nucleotidyltransferase n=1 Tax=Luteimicrobium subarcticum TaxID=620910 RepID=A0A2M8W1G8_9MICO|nr:nucleotidyltransferase [Luteimicrobium subarcticum]PJI84773.1 hypothetical protein CLV34_3231 [Luteimicrobium subarcticum]